METRALALAEAKRRGLTLPRRGRPGRAERSPDDLQAARSGIIPFCRHIDPRYDAAPHLRLLADKLAQVERYVETRGAEGIGRLIVNMPPRHGKSQTASKRWPAFLLGRHPDWHIALIAYQDGFAQDFSRANRALCKTNYEYHQLFPETLVHPESSAVDRWSLTTGTLDEPNVVAVGIDGALTGRGFEIVLIDDPIKNRKEAESKTYRKNLRNAYTDTILPRLEPGGAVILICTRWHEDDLAGYLIAEGQKEDGIAWEELSLPALAETDADPLGRQVGQALWPNRFDEASLERIKRESLDYAWQSEYQQHPVSPLGALFQRVWWREKNRYDHADGAIVNRCIGRWLSFDAALKDEEVHDFTACTVGELWPDYRLGVREITQERLQFPDLLTAITELARRYNRDGKLRGIIIEDKGSGTSSLQTLRAGSETWLRPLLIPFLPSGSKEARARQASVWCKKDCVLLPYVDNALPWLADFQENELFKFPGSAFDDRVDSFVQLILYLENLLAEGYKARGGTQ